MTKSMPTKIKADITPVEPESVEYPDEYKPLYIPTKLIKLNRFNPRTEADITADVKIDKNVTPRLASKHRTNTLKPNTRTISKLCIITSRLQIRPDIVLLLVNYTPFSPIVNPSSAQGEEFGK